MTTEINSTPGLVLQDGNVVITRTTIQNGKQTIQPDIVQDVYVDEPTFAVWQVALLSFIVAGGGFLLDDDSLTIFLLAKLMRIAGFWTFVGASLVGLFLLGRKTVMLSTEVGPVPLVSSRLKLRIYRVVSAVKMVMNPPKQGIEPIGPRLPHSSLVDGEHSRVNPEQ